MHTKHEISPVTVHILHLANTPLTNLVKLLLSLHCEKQVQLLICGNHSKLPILEDHSTVWNTGVVEQAGHQVHTRAKVFRGGGSDK